MQKTSSLFKIKYNGYDHHRIKSNIYLIHYYYCKFGSPSFIEIGEQEFDVNQKSIILHCVMQIVFR